MHLILGIMKQKLKIERDFS